jgi:hypothetical protein
MAPVLPVTKTLQTLAKARATHPQAETPLETWLDIETTVMSGGNVISVASKRLVARGTPSRTHPDEMH